MSNNLTILCEPGASATGACAHAPRVWIIGGGRLHLRLPLMRRLREGGFQMTAVGPEGGAQFEGTGFNYFQYPLERALNPVADRRAQKRLCSLLMQYRPDIVHAVNTKPCLLVPTVARRAGVPACVCTITGLGVAFSLSSPWSLPLRAVYRRLLKRASHASSLTVFQNPDDRAYFRQHGLVKPGHDRLVLGSGIDVDAFRDSRSDDATLASLRKSFGAEGKLIVTMVSRPIRPKGVEEFLKAAAFVRRRYPHVLFLLVGSAVTDGPLAVPISRIHQSAADVRHLDNRDDMPDILAISDLFVLPSYFREGVPRVLLEAGAMGLPLVTTDTPGCRETVRDGWNGLLVPPRDWRALAEAVLRLLESPHWRGAIARRSPSYMREKFDLAHVADAYAEIYRHVLGSRRSEIAAA